MAHGGESVTYQSARFQRARALRHGVIAGVLLWVIWSMSATLNSVVTIYVAVVVLALCVDVVGLVRCLRLGITLDDRGVTVRTTYTTRTYAWDTIERAETVDRLARQPPSSITASRRPGGTERFHVLGVLWLRNGKRVAFPGLRQTVGVHTGPGLWLDEAMLEANRRVKELRSDPDAEGPKPS